MLATSQRKLSEKAARETGAAFFMTAFLVTLGNDF
jgi:hypothetical protein